MLLFRLPDPKVVFVRIDRIHGGMWNYPDMMWKIIASLVTLSDPAFFCGYYAVLYVSMHWLTWLVDYTASQRVWDMPLYGTWPPSKFKGLDFRQNHYTASLDKAQNMLELPLSHSNHVLMRSCYGYLCSIKPLPFLL